ncbi:outer membrane protein [Legionella sp. CNM-4043-24]|uniref:outer membrane protein n=1 Tax=Legionella sp. CNM-4043-24 TaxID=3421646 RepID=UPI00403AD29F
MRAWYAGLGLAGLLVSITSGAGSMGAVQEEPPQINTSSCGKLITLSFGPAWYNQGSDVVRTFRFPNELTFVPKDVSGVVGSSELFFALSRPLDNHVSGQLGIAIGYNGNARQEGTLFIGEPPFLASGYSYQVSNARVALKGKLVADWGYVVQPYFSASAGVGFNRSWNYGYDVPSSAFLPLPDIRPWLADNTTVGFSYTAGLGVQANLSANWQAGAGYEFTDWGKTNFSRLRVQQVNRLTRYLYTSNFYTNALQLSVTYKFTDAPNYG